MRKLDLYWMSDESWWTFKNDIPVIKDDAPEEAKESFRRYIRQVSGEKRKI